LNASTGELFVHDVSALSWASKNGEIDDFVITLIGRILLSTDTVAETKQVNSSKISKDIAINLNPPFASITSGAIEVEATDRYIEVTLSTDAQLVAGPLNVNHFVITSGGTDGTAAAAAINAGLRVVRLADDKFALHYNSGAAGTISLEIKPEALRVRGGGTVLSTAKTVQSGIATINSATFLDLTSGVASTFIITLSGDKFNADLATGSGLGSGLTGAQNFQFKTGSTQLGESGVTNIQFSVSSISTDRASMTVTVTAIADPFDRSQLEIVIPAEAIGGTVPITVLTGNESVTLTSRPKLEIAFVE
jgi:hypothetical protein